MKKLLSKLANTGFCVVVAFILLCTSFSFAQNMDNNVPMGWASVPTSMGREGITGMVVESTIGGGNGRIVTAKTAEELATYAKGTEPLIIMIEGEIEGTGTIRIGSNKSIIGACSGATLKGDIELQVKQGCNVIMRNLKIAGARDAISIRQSHHVWIDHCDLSACEDGLLDITNGSDYVTVTWTKFHDHNKTMLINKGKQMEEDDDRMNVTLSHLSFINTVQRNPRVGYGKVHILNCYYEAIKSYAIHTYWNCKLLVEGCFFKDIKDAISQHKPGQEVGQWPGPGYAVLKNNKFDNSSKDLESTTDESKIFKIDDYYMYDWIVDDVEKVPDILAKGAGNSPEASKIVPIPTPGQGAVKVSTNPTLQWTKLGAKESNKVYFGEAFPPKEAATVNGYSHQPGNLKKGTVYYWKINDGDVWKFRTE